MKKVLVAAILGLATVTSVMAQGHVNISNYLTAPYNQVFWGSGTPLQGQALMDASIQLQIWYGAGVVTDASTLIPGITFAVNPTLGFNPGAGHGPGGYYGAQTQVVPTAGNYTFQIRASGTTAFGPATGASVLWQSTTISTALPAPTDPNSIGFVVNVPEPSSFALAGLGSAVLLIFRRRK